jgi:hypothetical protein
VSDLAFLISSWVLGKAEYEIRIRKIILSELNTGPGCRSGIWFWN